MRPQMSQTVHASPIFLPHAALNHPLSTRDKEERGFTMENVAAEMAEQTAQNQQNATAPADESIALDRRYGAIGISAVAAAARYWSAGKNPICNPTSAPASLKPDGGVGKAV